MKIFLPVAAICLLAVSNVSAQGISAGLRTGASCWSQRAPKGAAGLLEATPGQHISWDKELFVRWERKSRWAFEAGVSHSALTDRQRVIPYAWDPEKKYLRTRKSDNFELTLTAQYDITCDYMKTCPLMKRFRSYAGASITPSITRIRETVEFETYTLQNKMQPYQTWLGLSHTMLYQATKNLVISSVMEGRTDPAQLLSGDAKQGREVSPAARFSFRIGAGYRF